MDHGRLVTEGRSTTCWPLRATALPVRARAGPGRRRCGLAATLRGVAWVDGVDAARATAGSSCRSPTRPPPRPGCCRWSSRPGVRLAAFERVRPTARGRLPAAWSVGTSDGAARRDAAGPGPAAQGTARVVADAAAADRRRPVPARRPDLAAAREVPAGDHQGGRPATSCRPSPSRRRSPADAVDQLWKNLAQFGAFAAIILAMGAVATERDRGTAAFVLSKTVSRGRSSAPRSRHRRWSSRSASPRRRRRLVLHAILFEPLPVGGWVAWRSSPGSACRPGRPSRSLAARSPAPPRRRPGSASWRSWSCRSPRPSRASAASCRAGWPARRSRSRRARRSSRRRR